MNTLKKKYAISLKVTILEVYLYGNPSFSITTISYLRHELSDVSTEDLVRADAGAGAGAGNVGRKLTRKLFFGGQEGCNQHGPGRARRTFGRR